MTEETNTNNDPCLLSLPSSFSLPLSFVSEAPARLCLFGEHQDYLGLPVIACAIPLYCRIQVKLVSSLSASSGDCAARTPAPPPPPPRVLRLTAPSSSNCHGKTTQTTTEYDLTKLPPKQTLHNNNVKLDFAQAAIYEAMHTWRWNLNARGGDDCAVECVSTTEFPMQAGISSSSAFCVAFGQILAYLANVHTRITPLELAQFAHAAEVTHFQAPGGTMDHVTSAVGGLLRIGGSGGGGGSQEGNDPWNVVSLLPNNNKNHSTTTAAATTKNSSGSQSEHPGVWVLAYSGQPKETLRHLHRCKNARLELRQKLGGIWPDSIDAVDNLHELLSDDEQRLLKATLINRDMEQQAYDLWVANNDDHVAGENKNHHNGQTLAGWMQKHHDALRDGLQLSTPRLEAMNQAAHQAGAWGFKVVGSGGGGCAVAWTPNDDHTVSSVAMAMKACHADVQTWVISHPAPGARLVFPQQ